MNGIIPNLNSLLLRSKRHRDSVLCALELLKAAERSGEGGGREGGGGRERLVRVLATVLLLRNLFQIDCFRHLFK